MTPAKLGALLALADGRKARDLARLDGLIAADQALADEARALAGMHARDMAEGTGTAPLAVLGHRLAWAEARALQVRAARARLAAEIGAARAAAAVSFGRHGALEQLHRDALFEARRRTAAREEAERGPGAGDDEDRDRWL